MSKPPSKPDADEAAARVVRDTIAKHEQPLPAGIEAAWAEWSAGVGKVDARGMLVLRAAFEAGVEAGQGGGSKPMIRNGVLGLPDAGERSGRFL